MWSHIKVSLANNQGKDQCYFFTMLVMSYPDISCRRLWPICYISNEVDYSIFSSKRKMFLTSTYVRMGSSIIDMSLVYIYI